MKKIVISSLALFTGLATQAQVLYNNGATVFISSGAVVQVNGSTISASTSPQSNYVTTSAPNIPAGAKGTGQMLLHTVLLNDGDTVKIYGLAASNTVAPTAMKTDGFCKLYIVKLN